MEYSNYKKLKIVLYNLLKNVKNNNDMKKLKEESEDTYNTVNDIFKNIEEGKLFPDYFSKEDFDSEVLSEEEYNKKNNAEKTTIIKDLHKKISQVYIILAHYVNRDAHHNNTELFKLKDLYMENYIVHATLGGQFLQVTKRNDKQGNHYLKTHMKLIEDNKSKPIELHFGTRRNFIQNYNRIMDGAFRTLENFLPENSEEKKNFYKVLLKDFITSLEENDIEKQARFRPFTKFISQFPNDIELIKEAFSEVCDHDIDKDKEEFLEKLSCNIETIRQVKNGTNIEKNKAIAELIRNCQITQPNGKTSFVSGELSTLLNNIGYDVTNEQIDTLIQKKDALRVSRENRMLLEKFTMEKNNPQELMNLLTAILKENPEQISTISDIDLFYGENANFSNLLGVVQQLSIASDEEKAGLKKILIYRCVGIGTEGDTPLFEQSSKEQIIDFLKAVNIDIPDLDTKIEEAFTEKDLLQSEGWNLGTEPLTPRRFAEILKNGMIEHGIDFDQIDDVIEYYRKIDMLYGRDAEHSIEMVKVKIDRVLGEKKPDNYEEMKEQYDALYDDALEGRVPEFFEKLSLTFTPEEAAEYYEQSDEFEAEYNRYLESLEPQSKPIGGDD